MRSRLVPGVLKPFFHHCSGSLEIVLENVAIGAHQSRTLRCKAVYPIDLIFGKIPTYLYLYCVNMEAMAGTYYILGLNSSPQ